MDFETSSRLSAFDSSFKILIRSAKSCVHSINKDPNDLAIFCQKLYEVKNDQNKTAHIIGSGRSDLVGRFLGENLKNIGLRVSYLNDKILNPIKKNDCIIAVSGSGWNKLTNLAIEYGLRNNADILSFTGNPNSKTAKLSKAYIKIPMGFKPLDENNFFPISFDTAPISPLGSLFELIGLLIGIGITNAIYTGSFTKGFIDDSSRILIEAENFYNDLICQPNLIEFIEGLERYSNKSSSKIFVLGHGLNNIIAEMTAIRLRSIFTGVHSISDWRFRKASDLIILILGSSISSNLFNLMNIAKRNQMNVFSLCSFSNSEFIKKADNFLIIEGRDRKFNSDELQENKNEIFIPLFEFLTAVTLESCIAQIAIDLGISENLSHFQRIDLED